MPQKKLWTEQQDKILRKLFEEEKISKWSKIAQIMADQYRMPGRNGKQCRQRYQNALQPSFTHLQWTQEEQKYMYQLHDQVGNKWAQIAQRMPGRTDNCVKNHFYSNLRKAVRKLNKVISQEFKTTIKQVRPIVVYKIIEATDQHFKLSNASRKQISLNCGKLKNKLLLFASDNCQFQNNLPQLRQLAQQIQKFSKDYKRKPKKQRRGVSQSMNLMKVPKIDKFKCASDVQEDNSDMSIQVSERDSIHMGQKAYQQQQQVRVHKIKQVIEVSKNSLRMSKPEDQIQNKGIQLLLKNAGILQDGGSGSYNPFFKMSISQGNIEQTRQKDKSQKFNLGQSVQKFKSSFILKHSGEYDEELKLFRST